MSQETGDGTLGCGGVIILIIIGVVVLGALSSMGNSQRDDWCPPDHWACQEQEGKR